MCCCVMYGCVFYFFFVCKQRTAYGLRISDWSSDVCSSDLLIGVIAPGQFDPISVLLGGVTLRGTEVGSREMFEAMNRAISQSRIVPVIDRRFDFNQAREALRYLESAGHAGKVVITIE